MTANSDVVANYKKSKCKVYTAKRNEIKQLLKS